MELTEFFTSRVDLPSDAVDISAPTYSAAADILTERSANTVGSLSPPL